MKTTLICILFVMCHTCTGYQISTCSSGGKLVVSELRRSTLMCEEMTHDVIIWDFKPSDGARIQITSCAWPSSRCPVSDSDYKVTRSQYTLSILTINQNHRTKIAGTVRCGGAYGANLSFASCDVRVVYPAQHVSNCHTEVSTTDWTVSGSCDVDKIYASDGRYSCLWLPVSRETSFPLTSFTDNGLEYRRGPCSFSGQPMPTTDGTYEYRLKIDPGDGSFLGGSITIQHPGKPVLSNCPTSVIEGDDVSCSCQASGSPPAVVTWYTVNRLESVLQLRNVSRSQEGRKYTCNQYWGGFSSANWRTTTYSIQVYYPPAMPPVITGVQNGGHTEGEPLTLFCDVSGGKPPVTSITFWCGDGEDRTDVLTTVGNLTTLTSNVTFDSLNSTSNGTLCRCFATWDKKSSLYAETATSTITVIAQSVVITTQRTARPTTGATSNTPLQETSNDNSSNNDSALVGGTVGGIAIVIIVALIIVIVIMWKRRCDPVYAKPTSGGQDDTHTYTDLTVYERVGSQAPGLVHYENTTMQQEPGREQTQYENTDTKMTSSVDGQYENTTTEKRPAPFGSHYENTVEKRQEDADGVKYENTSTIQRLDPDKAK